MPAIAKDVSEGSTVDSVLKHPYLAALSEKPPAQTTSPLYLLALFAVALLMVLLPLVYLALIAAVGYATYWHATENVTIFESSRGARTNARAGFGVLLVYLTPIVVGGVLVVFMIKPLFAPRRMRHAPMSLNRRDEPLLFAFVDRLCDMVGSPRPARIDIDMELNASASLAGMLSRRVVLTLGLPLASTMTLNQFAGVLAHEFGHFAQRSAMRLSYLIRSINAWFARLVYERDSWDEALVNVQNSGWHWGVQLMAAIARLGVWMGRGVLWCLMWIGRIAGCILLRQMEYDADRASARVVGTRTASDMLDKLPLLGTAYQSAIGYAQDLWRDQALPADLAGLTRQRLDQMPGQIRNAIRDQQLAEKTGWFSTHPAERDRIAALTRTPTNGVFNIDAPATTLFRDFNTISRLMSGQFYRDVLGDAAGKARLVEVQQIEQDDARSAQQFEALDRYFQGLTAAAVPAFPTDDQLPSGINAMGEALLRQRALFLERAPAAGMSMTRIKQERAAMFEARRLVARLNAGFKSRPSEDLPKGIAMTIPALQEFANRAQEQIQKLVKPLASAQRAGMRRLQLAVAIHQAQQPAPVATAESETYDLIEAPEIVDRAGAQLAALRAMGRVLGDIETLHATFAEQAEVLESLTGQPSQPVVDAILARHGAMSELVESIRSRLPASPLPLEGATRTVVGAIITGPPGERQVGELMELVNEAARGFYMTYAQLMAELCATAERVEDDLGLPRLTAPPTDQPAS